MAYPSDRQLISIGLLRTVFTSGYVPQLFSGLETHDPALRFVAQIVPHIDDPERIRNIVAAALPESYEGDTLSEVPVMIEGAKRKGFGHRPGAKPKRDEKKVHLVDLIRRAGVELFHDALGRGFMAVPFRGGAVGNLLIRSSDAASWVRGFIYRTEGRIITQHALKDALETLGAMANFDGALQQVHLRVGGGAGSVVIDLGGSGGALV